MVSASSNVLLSASWVAWSTRPLLAPSNAAGASSGPGAAIASVRPSTTTSARTFIGGRPPFFSS